MLCFVNAFLYNMGEAHLICLEDPIYMDYWLINLDQMPGATQDICIIKPQIKNKKYDTGRVSPPVPCIGCYFVSNFFGNRVIIKLIGNFT